ncbi:GNAT family N-acetyltransferase [bacterium]|nr:GNAT family N-acetyltransferase [bacterium]
MSTTLLPFEMNITYQTFRHTENLSQQRNLFRSAFPENVNTSSESEDHYFWKFQSFPAEPPSYEFGASADNELIGYYAAIPYSYLINGQLTTCGMVCDVMTHPKMQGKGVFTGIGRHATNELQKNGVDFTAGYPIRPEVIPGHLKVGWKTVFNLPMYIKLLRSNAVLRSKKIGFAAPLVNAGLFSYNLVFSLLNSKNREYQFEILTRNEFLDLKEYETFFDKWKSQQQNVLLKTKEFLAWRTGAPQTEYKFVVIRKNRDIAGIAITRFVELKEIPSIAILDLMILNEDKNGLSALYNALVDIADRYNAEAIITMMSKRWAQNYKLKRMGFLKSPFDFSLIIKKLDPSMDDAALFDEAKWHLMWIDSDDL